MAPQETSSICNQQIHYPPGPVGRVCTGIPLPGLVERPLNVGITSGKAQSNALGARPNIVVQNIGGNERSSIAETGRIAQPCGNALGVEGVAQR